MAMCYRCGKDRACNSLIVNTERYTICSDCIDDIRKFLDGKELCKCPEKIENKKENGLIKTYYKVFNNETKQWEDVEYPEDDYSQR